ncbi:MAG: transcriptional repressor LexA [bacterium]|nr:transcriptional repressor LexA [bacterium]
MITKRQKEVLSFVESYSEKKGYSPSFEEIRRQLKLASVSTVHFHISKLKEGGYLGKVENRARAISITSKEPMVKIQLLGTIAAGEPIEAIQEKETIAISRSKIPQGDVYALRVSGNSMIDENINDGDLVIIRNQSTAENGQKVVALIDQESVTLKKFFKEKNKVRLQPANQALLPFFIEPERLTIQGIVVDVIKSTEKDTEREYAENILHTMPLLRRPKGGCELIYRGKGKEEELLRVKASELRLAKKYGLKPSNKLIVGDNLGILKNLCEDNAVRGKVDLVYIDPPFGTGQNFVGYDEENFYSDKLTNGEFLEFLRKRLVFLRELLSDTGSIYLHIDQKVGHYVKILMDEIFGEGNFRNDITRIKCNPKNFERKAFGNIKDVIYFYSKSKPSGHDPMSWSDYRLPLTNEEIEKQFPKIDVAGRRYATTPLHAKGETRNGPTGKEWKGMLPPKGRHWRYNPVELTRLDKDGLIEWSSTGNPRKKIYADENRGKKLQDVWDFRDPGFESALYPTQKNSDLLKQIIRSSTKKGNLVLDCFAGSGTTLLAAQELERSWIGIDLNKNAVNLIEKECVKLNASFGVYISS